MDIQTQYKEKLMTPEEAVEKFLSSGDVCAADIALAHSPLLYEAVGRAVKAGKLKNIT